MSVNKVEAVETEVRVKVKVEGLRGLREWPCSFLVCSVWLFRLLS